MNTTYKVKWLFINHKKFFSIRPSTSEDLYSVGLNYNGEHANKSLVARRKTFDEAVTAALGTDKGVFFIKELVNFGILTEAEYQELNLLDPF